MPLLRQSGWEVCYESTHVTTKFALLAYHTQMTLAKSQDENKNHLVIGPSTGLTAKCITKIHVSEGVDVALLPRQMKPPVFLSQDPAPLQTWRPGAQGSAGKYPWKCNLAKIFEASNNGSADCTKKSGKETFFNRLLFRSFSYSRQSHCTVLLYTCRTPTWFE